MGSTAPNEMSASTESAGAVVEPALIHARVDPERRFGLPAGKMTAVHQVVVFFMGAILAAAIYGLALLSPENLVSQSLLQRGTVPYAIVLFSAWSCAILVLKSQKIRSQGRVLSYRLVPDDPTFVLSPATVDRVIDRMHEIVDDPRRFLLFNRIHIALGNLRNMRRIGDVRDTLDSQAEHDEAASESTYSIVRGLIWAIPVLGFIGTVLGLSSAIGSFGDVLNNSDDIESLKPALRQVTGGLSIAFETTLQGLLAALVIHLWQTMVKRREEELLDDCKEYCQRQIVGRLRLSIADEE